MVQYKFKILALLTIAVIFSGCNLFHKERPTAVPYPEWVKNSVVYEINTRQYSPQGTFKALEADLPRVKDLGADILCFMPVYPIGGKDRKAPAGDQTSAKSYYSITDYEAVNPELGSAEDFKELVIKAHEMGFKVIIDWVASYTSRDHSWMTEHPGWYKKDTKGDPAIPVDRSDCALLDFGNKQLRKAMTGSMKFWVNNFDIDGFRCKMAGVVPTDFWEDAHAELLKVKPLYMLAGNDDTPELCNIAFDSNDGLAMYHLLAAISQGKMTAGEVLRLQSEIDSGLPRRAFKLNFITSHDGNAQDKTAGDRFGNAEKSCVVLTFTLPGMPLIYNGQEAEIAKQQRSPANDTIDRSNQQMLPFYKIVTGLKHRNPALWNPPYGGKVVPLTNTAPDKIVSFLRVSGNSRVMVLVNLSSESVNADITTAVADGKYVNVFNQNKIPFNADNRKCYFEPWEFLILEGE